MKNIGRFYFLFISTLFVIQSTFFPNQATLNLIIQVAWFFVPWIFLLEIYLNTDRYLFGSSSEDVKPGEFDLLNIGPLVKRGDGFIITSTFTGIFLIQKPDMLKLDNSRFFLMATALGLILFVFTVLTVIRDKNRLKNVWKGVLMANMSYSMGLVSYLNDSFLKEPSEIFNVKIVSREEKSLYGLPKDYKFQLAEYPGVPWKRVMYGEIKKYYFLIPGDSCRIERFKGNLGISLEKVRLDQCGDKL